MDGLSGRFPDFRTIPRIKPRRNQGGFFQPIEIA
jgi:hypothetical protein